MDFSFILVFWAYLEKYHFWPSELTDFVSKLFIGVNWSSATPGHPVCDIVALLLIGESWDDLGHYKKYHFEKTGILLLIQSATKSCREEIIRPGFRQRVVQPQGYPPRPSEPPYRISGTFERLWNFASEKFKKLKILKNFSKSFFFVNLYNMVASYYTHPIQRIPHVT